MGAHFERLNWPAEVALPEIDGFVEFLKAHGFSIGVYEHIQTGQLISNLLLKGNVLATTRDVLTHITPLLCKNQAQQAEIEGLFAAWLEQFDRPDEENPSDLQTDIKKQKKRNIVWILLTVAAVTVLFIYGATNPAPSNNLSSLLNGLFGLPGATQDTLPPPPTGSGPSPNNPQPFPVWTLALIALLVFALVTIRSIGFYSAYMILKRRFPNLDEGFSLLKLPKPLVGDREEILRARKWISRFNRRIELDQPVVDFLSAVKATAANAGLTTLQYVPDLVIPEYLLLIDKASGRDVQAESLNDFLQLCDAQAVRHEVFYFNRDIRNCYKNSASGSAEFSQLTKRYPNHVLLLFSTGNGLLHPLSGQMEKWASDFLQDWHHKILFSPENPQPGQHKYAVFQRNGFQIYPMSAKGLATFAATDISPQPAKRPAQTAHFLPSLLYDQPMRWIDRNKPADSSIQQMLGVLKEQYLGTYGFAWLCACAIYPEIHLELTLYLGKNMLRDDQVSPVFTPALLSRLMQLPWFRYAYMPDWLRKVLLHEMYPGDAGQARQLVYNWFFSVIHEKEAGGALTLDIAVNQTAPAGNIKQHIFNRIARATPDKSIFKDYIFTGFMNDALAFKAPRIPGAAPMQWKLPGLKKIVLPEILKNEVLPKIVQHLLIALAAGLLMSVLVWKEIIHAGNLVSWVYGLGFLGLIAWLGYDIIRNLDIPKLFPRDMPPGLPYLLGFEFAERFSYYGMRAVLVTFLASTFFLNESGDNFSEANRMAFEHVLFFTTYNYIMPLIGGMVADWFFGKYRVTLWLSLVYCFGSLMLVWAAGFESLWWVTISLELIAIGSSSIKATISALIGDQYTNRNYPSMAKAYSSFYFLVNLGALLSMFLTPFLYTIYGITVAFALPAFTMVTGTLVFWLGKKKIRKEQTSLLDRRIGSDWITLVDFKSLWGTIRRETAQAIPVFRQAFAVLTFIPIFWLLWNQSSSDWILQAQHLDLTLFGDISLSMEQVQTSNTIMVLILIPVFTSIIYPYFNKRVASITPLRKIGAGFAFTTLSFAIIATIQHQIDMGDRPSVWWQILAYFILTIGEVLIAISGLEFTYSIAPKRFKSIGIAFWLIMIPVGNYLVKLIYNTFYKWEIFSNSHNAYYFWLYFGIGAVTTVLFILVARRIKLGPPEMIG